MPENSNRSSGSMFVLVDQPAQPVVSTYPNPMVSDLPIAGVRSVLDCERTTGSLGFRDLLGQPLVGAVAVAVTGIASKDPFEMPFVHDQEVFEALRSDGAHEPFSKRVGIRGSKGRLQDLSALGSEDVVEARHVIGATITDQGPWGDVRVSKVTGDVPRLLSDPRRVRMSGHAGDPDPPAAEFDEEQHIEAFERHGVDMEEVCRYDSRRLGTQELTPGGSTRSRSGTEAVVLHDPCNGARGKPYSELGQLTLDASVTPSRVLTRQAHNQSGRVIVDGRSTW